MKKQKLMFAVLVAAGLLSACSDETEQKTEAAVESAGDDIKAGTEHLAAETKEAAVATKDKASELAQDAKVAADNAGDHIKAASATVADKTSDAVENIKEGTVELGHDIKEGLNAAGEKIDNATDRAVLESKQAATGIKAEANQAVADAQRGTNTAVAKANDDPAAIDVKHVKDPNAVDVKEKNASELDGKAKPIDNVTKPSANVEQNKDPAAMDVKHVENPQAVEVKKNLDADAVKVTKSSDNTVVHSDNAADSKKKVESALATASVEANSAEHTARADAVKVGSTNNHATDNHVAGDKNADAAHAGTAVTTKEAKETAANTVQAALNKAEQIAKDAKAEVQSAASAVGQKLDTTTESVEKKVNGSNATLVPIIPANKIGAVDKTSDEPATVTPPESTSVAPKAKTTN